MGDKKIYYRRLDILRIVSCLLVFLYHLSFIKGGFLAVCIFFTLSGYLGCMSAIKSESFSIKKYYINRIKMIYLPLIIVILLTVILAKVIPSIRWINLKPESMSALLGYNNFWQLNANLDYFTRHINSPFIHLWYIAILLQFELVFPVAVLLFKKLEDKTTKHLSTIVVFVLSIASIGYFIYLSNTQQMMAYYNTFARCFSILLGVLLAIVHYKYNLKIIKVIKKHSIIPYVIYILITLAMCVFVSSESSYYALFMILITLISLRLIEYSTIKYNNDEVKNTIIDFFSKSSYEIYLVQYPVIFFAGYLIENNLLRIAVIVLVTLIISFIIHFLLNNRARSVQIIAAILFSVVIICGTAIVIAEEDHTQEMKELEQTLNSNLKEIESKNAEYLNDINTSKAEWDKLLNEIESGESAIKEMVTNLPVVGIGDSVLLAASPGLYKVFPNGYFDGKVSRTIVGGRELLSELIDQGKVGNVVILALANNGDYITKRNKDMMEVVGDREVFWINAVLADVPEFNEKFAEFAKDYPNLHIIDWEGYSKDYPEFFYKDGIHVKGDGVNAYANLVYDSIYNFYLEKYKEQFKEKIDKYEQEIEDKTQLIEENNSQIEDINNKIEDLKNDF
ncbi:MAG: acyltransferase family protein [Clostridia bacterium]|nr:acyltransferase family protein [Clostridia bacterium]